MAIIKRAVVIFLVTALAVFTLAGCKGKAAAGESQTEKETEAEATLPEGEFSYSSGINENGFWNIKALDYAELPEYMGITIPKSVHEVSDADLQAEIDSLMSGFASVNEVKDRAVVDGDKVNIDYVGSIDGVEFEAGSTGGTGAYVTIGVTRYIDDFLEQLIGHVPGEEFDIEVTFPEDYGNEELNGKDAVFAITLNHILETTYPEITDAFVAENFAEEYGWKTAADMREGTSSKMRKTAVLSYLYGYLIDNSKVETVPQLMLQYCEGELVKEYSYNAEYYGMELEEFLQAYAGVETVEQLKAQNADQIRDKAGLYIIVQAVAEAEKISVDEEDVAEYFSEYMGGPDYSSYEKMYGLPYLKSVVIYMHVLEHIRAAAVLE